MTAYDKTYVLGAQERLGALFDFATFGLGLDLARIHGAFLASPLSRRFAAGDPAVVAGRSGEELALEILGVSAPDVGAPKRTPRDVPAILEWSPREVPTVLEWSPREVPTVLEWSPHDAASPEYWTGWALAFYQWASGYAFSAIEERVRIDDVRSLYTPYHEMDIRQLCDRLDELCAQAHPQTNLQARRLAAGLSQSQLSRASDVPVRTLQQYEQRQKNINHARADYVDALARALCCNPADLLERAAQPSFEYAAISL